MADDILTTGSSAARKPPLAILVAVSAIGPLALNIFIPSMPGLQRALDAEPSEVQLTLTLYLFAIAVAQLGYGPLSDRFGRRPVLLTGLVIFTLASIACALAPNLESLIVARVFQAIGGCSGMVLSRAIVRDLYDREKSASILGYITMAWVIAPMLAPSIGGLLDVWFGWRASFLFLVVVGALTLLATLRWLHETNFQLQSLPGLVGLLAGYRGIARSRAYLCYVAQTSFGGAIFFSFLAGAPYVMVEILGRTPLEYGLYFALVSLGYMTGNGISGRFSQAVGIRGMLRLSAAFTLLGCVAMTSFFAAGWVSVAALFLPMVSVALGNGMGVPNGTAGAVSVDPSRAGAAAGLAGFLQMTIAALGSQIVGFLQTGSALPMSVVMLIFAFGGLAAFLALPRSER